MSSNPSPATILASIRGCYPCYDTCLAPETKGAGVIRGIVGFGFGGTAAMTVLFSWRVTLPFINK
jgi:hypothetical protein